MNILLATNDMSQDGSIYDMNSMLCSLANSVYLAINQAGDIT